jgi:zeaxanthin glucosyltransferase
MATIVFSVVPAMSHYNASFGIARLLQSYHHTILYVAESNDFEPLVIAQGFAFRKIVITDRSQFSEYKKKRFLNFLSEHIHFVRVQKKVNSLFIKGGLFDQLMRDVRPDLIILDCNMVNLAFLLFEYKVKVISLCTMLSVDKDVNVPPLTSGFIPDQSILSKWYTELLWQLHFAKRSVMYLFFKLIHFGIPLGLQDRGLLAKIAVRSRLSADALIISNRAILTGLKNVPEIILTPRALDFPRVKKLHYLSFKNHLQRNEAGIDEPDRLQEDQLAIMRSEKKNCKLIYCSLGTVNVDHFKGCSTFFEQAIAAVSGKQDVWMILSTGMVDPATLQIPFTMEPNVFVYRKVPQLEVLKCCDIMITHGGLQSITECVLFEVPMIVYPLNAAWDQQGNAARVVFHKLGVRGNIKQSDTRRIRESINRIFYDYAHYKNNLHAMKLRILEEQSGSDAIAQLLSFLGNADSVHTPLDFSKQAVAKM